MARLVGDSESRPYRSLWIVAMSARDAEHADDRVADELLDDPTVELDLRASHGEVPSEHSVDVFRIGALARRREADEIAEQGRDDLALLGHRRAGAAATREPQPLQNLDPSGFSVEQAAHRSIAERNEPALGVARSAAQESGRLDSGGKMGVQPGSQ